MKRDVLEADGRALFQGLVVDFDPVRSTLDGRGACWARPSTAARFPRSL